MSAGPSGIGRERERERVRDAWQGIFHLTTRELWGYRVAILLFAGLVVATAIGWPTWVQVSTAVPAVLLALWVLLPLRRRYRAHRDRHAAAVASRSFGRYLLTGREP